MAVTRERVCCAGCSPPAVIDALVEQALRTYQPAPTSPAPTTPPREAWAALAQRIAPASPTTAIETVLTAQQQRVLRLMAADKTNLEIGARLGISPMTVKNYATQLFAALGVRGRAGAVARGYQLGLLAG